MAPTESRRLRRTEAPRSTPRGTRSPSSCSGTSSAFADKVAIREKDYGIWQSYTWREYLEQARLIALGLAALGFQRGDKTAIVGDNRPQLYWAMLAHPGARRACPCPLYQDSIEKEMEFIVDHAEARFAIVEDQEQVDKLLQVQARCPRLEHIVYDDPRGLRHYDDAGLAQPGGPPGARAGGFDQEHPGYFEREVAAGPGGRRRDHLLHVGHDRAAEGHDAVLPEPDRHRPERRRVRGAAARPTRSSPTCRWRGSATTCSRSPSRSSPGFTTNCPESTATVLHDLREIGPTYFFAPPGIYQRDPDHGHDPDRGLRGAQARGWSGSSWTWRDGSSGAGWPGSPCRPGSASSTPWAGCSSTARCGTTSA